MENKASLEMLFIPHGFSFWYSEQQQIAWSIERASREMISELPPLAKRQAIISGVINIYFIMESYIYNIYSRLELCWKR